MVVVVHMTRFITENDSVQVREVTVEVHSVSVGSSEQIILAALLQSS